MEIEQRNKLAAIMFDIKHKIKDGEYKEFMDILGKKEVEPNIENIIPTLRSPRETPTPYRLRDGYTRRK